VKEGPRNILQSKTLLTVHLASLDVWVEFGRRRLQTHDGVERRKENLHEPRLKSSEERFVHFAIKVGRGGINWIGWRCMIVVYAKLAGCGSSDKYLDESCYGKESKLMLVITSSCGGQREP
jgi:hypothetical protein